MKISPYYESSKRVQKLIKEGRGKGVGENYLPWVTTYDFSSKGRVTRTFGIKTHRLHQLQSDNQLRAFLIFEFSDRVVDIRESYPLLDVMETVNDSSDLRFDKFQDKQTGEPYVITTNFVLTVKDDDGKERFIARSVKNASELRRKITWDRLEIERRYWAAKGVSWKIITNKELSRRLAQNIEWVRDTLNQDDNLDKETKSLLLLREIYDNYNLPIRQILTSFDKTEGLEKGTGLYLFRYLIAKKEIQVDMRKEIHLSSTAKELFLRR